MELIFLAILTLMSLVAGMLLEDDATRTSQSLYKIDLLAKQQVIGPLMGDDATCTSQSLYKIDLFTKQQVFGLQTGDVPQTFNGRDYAASTNSQRDR